MVGAAVAPTAAATSAARAGSASRDDEPLDAGCRGQQSGMEPPDPTRAEKGDPHREPAPTARADPARRRAAVRTRRPIAALSDGGPQQLSCSTISQPS